MTTFPPLTTLSLNSNKMVNEQDIKKAIDALDAQEKPNYSQVAKDFQINRRTLMRRHKGQTTSRAQATSQYHKLLTDTQEDALIDQINKLTARGLPPTSQIVQNLAEEIIGREVNKN
jgi:methanogenic corrinoid protein MtbC1